MFCVWAKVLFFRQIYGLKRRWVMVLITVLYTVFFVSLLPIGRVLEQRQKQESETSPRTNPGPGQGPSPGPGSSPGSINRERTNTVEYGETDSAFFNPLVILVSPHNSKTQQLITGTYSILERESRNASLFNVHVSFMENEQQMRRTLEKSVLPSVGVEFQEVTKTKLEYTLIPVIDPRKFTLPRLLIALSPAFKWILSSGAETDPTIVIGDSNYKLSRRMLHMQAAIDSAYIQTYFPDSKHLQIRSFPDYSDDERQKEDLCKPNVSGSAFNLSLSLLLLMVTMATYIVREKASGVRELFCVNGLPRWMVNSGWLFCFSVLAFIIALLQLWLAVIPESNPSITNVSYPLFLLSLIIYGWNALAFTSFVASMFSSQTLTILLILLYWMVSAVVATVFVIFIDKLDGLYAMQNFISIVPNFGFYMFFRVLSEFCEADTELSFGNLFTPTGKSISAGMALVMMIIGTVLFLVLASYLDLVKPGPYGRAMPWYIYRRKDRMAESLSEDASVQEPDMFEGIDANVPIGLKCVDIVKIFGTFKALNKVNLDIIKNKVTILLGHNGAGKTTLFSILCGMFSPTSGKVYTDEYSVFEGDNLKKFRWVLGYCPQENLVLNELSAQEHLIVFGMLKCLTKSEARAFSDQWTTMFDMHHMRHTQAKNLSGGTKRKLCLAIAMTGEPEYLLLDEPSAGMDIESTRKVWNVLLEQKGNCTVVITTHNMDEAEVLGDQIAILAHGQIKCLGSSSFLKKTLESGYRLNCSVTNQRSTDEVIKAVNGIIRGASVLYKTNRSVTMRLPSNQINYIPDLLRGLEKEFGESVSSTLSQSTLDDVFIKVQQETGVKVNVEELPFSKQEDMKRSCWDFIELVRRRVKWTMSHRMVTALFAVILLPNIATLGGVFCVYSFIKGEDAKTVKYIHNESPGAFAILSDRHDDVSDRLRSTLSKNGIDFRETNGDLNDTLIVMARKNIFEYRSNLLFAFDTADSDHPTAYFRNTGDHAVTKAYSALVNALLQGKSTIVTRNAPALIYLDLKNPYSSIQYANIICPIFARNIIAGMFFLLVGPFFLVACAYFVVFPHEERTTLFKHLQLMTGLLPIFYWLVNFLFDFLLYICSCTLTIIIFACLNSTVDVFLEPTVLKAIVLGLILFGISSIFLSYIGSFFFRTSAISISLIILASILTSIVFAILAKVVDYEKSYFIPYPILWNFIHKTLLWSFSKRDCDACSDRAGCAYVGQKLLFTELKNEFIWFACLSAAYLMIVLFLDHGLGRNFMGLVQKVCFGRIKKSPGEPDPEVALEKERVAQLRSKGQDEQPELVCDGLAKKYSRKRTAVYDVTFTAERGECFGLVGVNGAGKTTTFGMLTALLAPTKGTAVVEGRWRVTGCSYNYLKRVGYCPQYEGLLRDLPARTIIRLFGRLGGVPKKQIGPLVEKWIEALDMTEIAHRPCGHYSGGNRRKLSLAMALIGNPPVLLLDEPTAGVDPVVRRKVWEILTTSLEQHERTIILTSHTMSECEAICDRLTIMVKGVMKCLGSIPMLKKTFGKSCILEIKLSGNSNLQQQNAVRKKIKSQFVGYISLHDTQPTRVVYLLKTEKVKTYEMFAAMLRIQSENPIIEDFNLSETPLEQVFLMFAKKK